MSRKLFEQGRPYRGLIEALVWLRQSLRANTGLVLRADHQSILTSPSEFIIHQSVNVYMQAQSTNTTSPGRET